MIARKWPKGLHGVVGQPITKTVRLPTVQCLKKQVTWGTSDNFRHILTNLRMKKRCVRYQALCPVSSAVSDIKRCVRYQALCSVSSAMSGILHVSSIKRCIQFLITGWFYMF